MVKDGCIEEILMIFIDGPMEGKCLFLPANQEGEPIWEFPLQAGKYNGPSDVIQDLVEIQYDLIRKIRLFRDDCDFLDKDTCVFVYKINLKDNKLKKYLEKNKERYGLEIANRYENMSLKEWKIYSIVRRIIKRYKIELFDMRKKV